MLLALCACQASHPPPGPLSKPPSQNADVVAAKAFSEAAPTQQRYKQLTDLVRAKGFPLGCSGNKPSDWLHAYRAIELFRYRNERYPVDESAVRTARRFLNNCSERGKLQIAGLALYGIGLHGEKQDATAIYRRAMINSCSTGGRFNSSSVGTRLDT